MPRVSVIMANYNGLGIGVLRDSISSVLRSSFSDFELIVVDNGSTDGSTDFLKAVAKQDPRVKMLCKDHNIGYSAANNYAAQYAGGEYLAFLHNDTSVRADWLEELLSVIETDERIGVVQPQIRDSRNPSVIISEGNMIDKLGFVIVEHFGEQAKPRNRPSQVLSATAACMLFRRRAFETAGGFDEDYFLSYDEIDLCWRTWLTGYEIYCAPNAVVWHSASTTVDRFFRAKVSYFDSKNRLKSIIKNYERMLLARYLVPSVLATAFLAMRKLTQGDTIGAIAIARGLGKAFAGLAGTLQQRRSVQTSRKIEDSFLLDRGLISPINFAGLYQRLTAK